MAAYVEALGRRLEITADFGDQRLAFSEPATRQPDHTLPSCRSIWQRPWRSIDECICAYACSAAGRAGRHANQEAGGATRPQTCHPVRHRPHYEGQ
jgi:hypothetical protein